MGVSVLSLPALKNLSSRDKYETFNINSLSFNNIIYGHGRLNKTVFGSLKDTLDKKWQSNKDNLAIYISTPNENMIFQIFSIYTIKSESYYINTLFNNKNEKSKWLDTMIQRNTSAINTSVDTNDKILTLSTCLDDNGGRVVVQAKLIKTQKRQKIKSFYADMTNTPCFMTEYRV